MLLLLLSCCCVKMLQLGLLLILLLLLLLCAVVCFSLLSCVKSALVQFIWCHCHTQCIIRNSYCSDLLLSCLALLNITYCLIHVWLLL